MLSRTKLEEYLTETCDEQTPEVRRFIKDLMIKIEFGHFEPDDNEESEDNAYDNA
ncbi:hypothetical protein M3223_04210 [Paenibacillus pasadenensis]|uniref:hypothetical protein n=1 Tax=Paenibacillus pasadenensis TaxID=217090 RepID=UPI00204266E9|nr:hypothetical protein [Paenibacillus pasadenensis]MCM3746553.1 hypothetical protein [Paenibacillus pasadenensis]